MALSCPQRYLLQFFITSSRPDLSTYLDCLPIPLCFFSQESSKPHSPTRPQASNINMRQSVTGIGSLPTELILHVASFLRASRRFACIPDLVSCALVCKRWLSIFKSLIYPIQVLDSGEKLREFVKAAIMVPKFIPRVRRLELYERAMDKDSWVDTVASVLPRNLIYLRSIALHNFHTHSQTPRTAQHLHIAYPVSKHLARLSSSFGAVTKLEFDNCKFDDLNHLVRIVCNCVQLAAVHLRKCEWKYIGHPLRREFRRTNNALRVVQADFCDQPLFFLWLFVTPEVQTRTCVSKSRASGLIKSNELSALREIIENILPPLENQCAYTTYFERNFVGGEFLHCTVISPALITV